MDSTFEVCPDRLCNGRLMSGKAAFTILYYFQSMAE